jgi:hypothetical protein
MELRFLSPELKSISDPDEQDIEDALMKLALLKGKEKRGASSFIQTVRTSSSVT